MPELPPIEQRLVAILKRASKYSRPCGGCGTTVYLIPHNKKHGGEPIAYDERGMMHFANCRLTQPRKAKAAGGAA